MRILFVGDVFGPAGRRAVEAQLPDLRRRLEADFCIVNGENIADGAGITVKLAEKLLAAGADVVTTGNHVWRRRDVYPLLESSSRVIRPANIAAPGAPGRGLTVQPAVDGTPVAVMNLQGALFLNVYVHPFGVVDELVEEARRSSPVIVVDFHAEATSEKIALARMLDGRVTAVLGTHTHVQTNDARVLPGGTAAITDAGMTGPHDSVIGVKAELAIERMKTGLPVRFEPASGDVRIEGVLSSADRMDALRAASPCACRSSEHASNEHDEQGDEHEVADEHEPADRPQVDDVPVARREPDLRQDKRRHEQERGAEPRDGDRERHERNEPDQELRREDLSERDEGDDRRSRAAEEPGERVAGSGDSEPDRDDGDDLQKRLNRSQSIRKRAGKVLGPEGRDDGWFVQTELLAGQEQCRPETFDLKRAAGLTLDARPHALGSK